MKAIIKLGIISIIFLSATTAPNLANSIGINIATELTKPVEKTNENQQSPEPATLFLFGIGLAGMASFSKRIKNNSY